MSDESMREKFGRRLRDKEKFGFDFSVDFEVESYLRYRGSQFVTRFDATPICTSPRPKIISISPTAADRSQPRSEGPVPGFS